MRYRPKRNQDGVSLTGLIMAAIVVSAIAVLGMKLVPTVIEYYSIKKAVAAAKGAGTPAQIRASFDKYATAGYIDSISGRDLKIERVGDDVEVSFSYEKKIPLFGPATLLIDYEGTTAKTPMKKDSKLKNI